MHGYLSIKKLYIVRSKVIVITNNATLFFFQKFSYVHFEGMYKLYMS